MTEFPRPAVRRPVLVAVGIVFIVAFGGSTLTVLGPWYEGLTKPAWQPPPWVFPTAWTIIYVLTATAGVMAWTRAPDHRRRVRAFSLFIINAILNLVWSAVFFTWQRPDYALVEVALLWLSIIAVMIAVWRCYKPATWLLVPYLVWVSAAALLNWEVVRLNGPFG